MLVLSLILFFSTLVTATISGALGMGGGVLLLSVMTWFLPHQTIIPLHGLIQMQNNAHRIFLLRKFIRRDFLLFFILGAIPGVMVAAYFLKRFEGSHFPLFLILVLILYSVFKPKKMPALVLPAKMFSVVGLFAGFLGIFIGATGPFIANFFVRDDFSQKEIVANKSAMQAFLHLLKLPVFLYLGFDYFKYLIPLLAMSLGGLIGTKYGVGLIEKINKELFIKLFKLALLIAGARIAYRLLTL